MRATSIARLARTTLRRASARTLAPALLSSAPHHLLPGAQTPLAAAARAAAPGSAISFPRMYSTSSDSDDEYFEDSDDGEIQYPLPTVRVQSVAPSFSAPAVVNGEIIESLSLQQYRGQYVVLFFYPKDFTYVCPTEIIAFNDRAEEFAAVNTQLIAVSCDTAESHLAWTKLPRSKGGLGKMSIPLVSDGTKAIANKYGVLLEEAGVALRGLFILDKEGVVHQITVNNLPIGRSVDETLRLVKALQFVEEHGEVCPANWQPGEKTIVADPKHASEYFATVEDKEETAEYEGIAVVKNKQELQAVLAKDKLVVVKFEAGWCGKCVQIQPFVKQLADEFKGKVTFATVDVDLPEVAPLKKQYGVEALPSFRFFKNGKEVGTPVIGYKKTPLKSAVENLAQ